MKATAFLAVVACVLVPRVTADVHSRSYFVFDQATGAFANAYLDYDDETKTLSAWSDYSALQGTLVAVDIEGSQGSLVSLSHDGGNAGFAFGVGVLDATDEQEFFAGTTQFVYRTTAAPTGELFVSAFFGSLFTHEAALVASQVVAGSSSLAAGSAFLTVDVEGQASLSGFANAIEGTITSVEVRGPAYFGQTGPLIAATNQIGSNGSSDTFTLDWTPAGEQALSELADGLVYVVVTTDAFPAGEIRGQLAASTLGRSYCPGRPNSVGFNGAGLSATGSILAADDDLTLNGFKVPVDKPVLPIVGLATGHLFDLPATAGTLCVGGGPFARLSAAIGAAAPDGTFSAPIDSTTLPFGAPQPGQVLNFQLWYRDVVGQVPTSNLSSAVSIRYH